MKKLAPQIVDVLKYVCTDENLAAEIVVAEGAPNRLIKGSMASPSAVV